MTFLDGFIVPKQFARTPRRRVDLSRVAAIVPCYAPGVLTVQLVSDLARWNSEMQIIVVDDCTPESKGCSSVFAAIAAVSPQVTMLRTPTNKLKAGAINVGIAHLKKQKQRPRVIVTLDDDVQIEEETIQRMVYSLMSDKRIGAVCAQNFILNKKATILTRLQGLEYLGFNIMRMADEGFLYGPLVMPGMLTAFRFHVVNKVGGFAEQHLIEDYEMTTRIKEAGWHVRMVPGARAWTEAPETLEQFWRQRARWVYGGLTVIGSARFMPAVLQDWIGHLMFSGSLIIIAILLWTGAHFGNDHSVMANVIFFFAFVQLMVWYVFQVWAMRLYPGRDWVDWFLRISIIPEFLYAHFMAAVLVMAYCFHTFTLVRDVLNQKHPVVHWLCERVSRWFASIGYSAQWGTRSS